MKIISVEIAAFGKLQDVKADFLPNFNYICNVNGFGKSTLAAFVRAMLFGLNYNFTKIGDERVNDVTRYCPWNSTGKFGGAMTVEHNGKRYRIERFFGQTARSQTLAVTEVASGKRLDITDVGGYFLGLTADSYDRSTYFPQEYVELASNENISSRLANVVEGGADYDQVAAKIREYKKSFKYERGTGGLIFDLTERHADALRKLEQAKSAVAEKERAEVRIGQIKQEVDKIREQKKQNEQRLAALNEQILRSEPTASELNSARLVSEAEVKVASYPKGFEQIADKAEEIGNQAENQAKKPQTSKKIKLALLVIAILFIAGGAAALFFLKPLGFALIGVGAVLAVAALVVKPKPTAAAAQKEKLLGEYFDLASKIVDCSDYDYYKTKNAIANLKRQYYQDVSRLNALRENAPAQRTSPADLSALKRQAEGVSAAIADLSASSERLIAESARLSAFAESVTDNRAEIEDAVLSLWQKLDKAKRDYAVACQVADLIDQAKSKLSLSYLPALCKRTTELLNAATAGSYRVVLTDKFQISVIEGGQTHGFSSYSRGIREMTLLCFRIALSQMLYGGKIPLLILDDAFVNFDDANYARAMQLLNQMTPQTQIVYLTCHSRK